MKPVQILRESERAGGCSRWGDGPRCWYVFWYGEVGARLRIGDLGPGSDSRNRSRNNGEVRTGRRRDVRQAWAQGEEGPSPGNGLTWEIGPEQRGQDKVQAEKEVQRKLRA